MKFSWEQKKSLTVPCAPFYILISSKNLHCLPLYFDTLFLLLLFFFFSNKQGLRAFGHFGTFTIFTANKVSVWENQERATSEQLLLYMHTYIFFADVPNVRNLVRFQYFTDPIFFWCLARHTCEDEKLSCLGRRRYFLFFFFCKIGKFTWNLNVSCICIRWNINNNNKIWILFLWINYLLSIFNY